MSKKSEVTPHTRSWRAIKQSGKNRAVTFQAKKKRMQRTAVCALYLILVAAAVSFLGVGAYLYKSNPSMFYIGGSSSGVKQIHFETDGVLTHDWLKSKLHISKNTGLMEIDIHELDEKLESEGQVISVAVKRSFPDALIIDVREHTPVLRLMISEKNRSSREMLVSSDGTVYQGHNYANKTLRQLPWLAGVRVKKGKNGYAPVPGMSVVAELLEEARSEIPHYYLDWWSVNCEDFDGRANVAWAVIKVKTKKMGEIIFVPKDFKQQLIRLDGILSSMNMRDYSEINRIDLSLGDHSAVKLTDTGFGRGTSRKR